MAARDDLFTDCTCPPWVNSVEETCDNCKTEINAHNHMVEEKERAENEFEEANVELSSIKHDNAVFYHGMNNGFLYEYCHFTKHDTRPYLTS